MSKPIEFRVYKYKTSGDWSDCVYGVQPIHTPCDRKDKFTYKTVIEKSAYDQVVKKLMFAYQYLHPNQGMDIGIGRLLKDLGELPNDFNTESKGQE